MRFTRNQVASFEVGISSMWIIHFDDGALNLIAGNFPAISVKFGMFEANNTEIEVGPNHRFKVPTSAKGPSTIDIEFYDDDHRTIHNAIAKKVHNSPMFKSGRSFVNIHSISGSTKSGAIGLTVELHSKLGKLVKSYKLQVWPTATLDFAGDQEFKASQGSIGFEVLSYES